MPSLMRQSHAATCTTAAHPADDHLRSDPTRGGGIAARQVRRPGDRLRANQCGSSRRNLSQRLAPPHEFLTGAVPSASDLESAEAHATETGQAPAQSSGDRDALAARSWWDEPRKVCNPHGLLVRPPRSGRIGCGRVILFVIRQARLLARATRVLPAHQDDLGRGRAIRALQQLPPPASRRLRSSTW